MSGARRLIFVSLAGALGCERPAAPDAGAAVVVALDRPDVPAPTVVPAAPRPAPEAARVTGFAALDATHMLALSRRQLYRATAGAWRVIPLAGAEPRAVGASRGALWVLARGVGAQSGQMMLLRSAGLDDLALAMVVPRPEGFEPTSVALARGDQDFYIGGSGPRSILRVRWATAVEPLGDGAAVASLRYTGDEVLTVRYADGAQRAWRWGEWNVLPPAFAMMVAGTSETLSVQRDGAIVRGYPWATGAGARLWRPASGFEPVDAVVRGGGAVEVAADGRAAEYDDGAWREIVAVPTARVEGLVAAPGPLAVAVDGAVFRLTGVHWERAVTAVDAGDGGMR